METTLPPLASVRSPLLYSFLFDPSAALGSLVHVRTGFSLCLVFYPRPSCSSHGQRTVYSAMALVQLRTTTANARGISSAGERTVRDWERVRDGYEIVDRPSFQLRSKRSGSLLSICSPTFFLTRLPTAHGHCRAWTAFPRQHSTLSACEINSSDRHEGVDETSQR